MLKVLMSTAASGLLRAVLDRAGDRRDRILLSEIRSVDWQSLTFAGERHVISLRIPAPDAEVAAHRLVDGIEDAEFHIVGHIVADIAVSSPPARAADGSVTLGIEALTVDE